MLSRKNWYNNIFLRPKSSDYEVFEQIFLYTSYGELEKAGRISTIIDAGANVGLSSVYFSNRLGNPEIIGLEPDIPNFRQALRNTASLPKVEIINKALWHEEGKGRISNPNAEPYAFQVVPEINGNISYITVLKILEMKNWPIVDLLKIDIEGAENELFSDPHAHEWLNRVKIIAIELHDRYKDGCSLSFFKAISCLQSINVLFSGESMIIFNKKLYER